MKYADVIKAVEKVADPRFQAPWDKSGSQVASTRSDVTCLAVFLDPVPENIRRALERGADCLLSHHPLALKPELPNRVTSYYESLKILFAADAPLYAAHTSLDVNPEGPAGWLRRELGASFGGVLEKIPGSELGYGETAVLPEPVPAEELTERLLQILGLDEAFACGPAPAKYLSRLAWCGGSGASLIEAAQKEGAQLFLTGDVKHHAALDAEIPVLDVGHHSVEEGMMREFANLLARELEEIKVIFISSKSPFRAVYRKARSR